MRHIPLGSSQITVSEFCLGSMTWASQNSEAEAHAQIDCALDHGINFIDTAEMYPSPPKKETAGNTEIMIGNWLEKTGRRSDIVLASKIVGPNGGMVRDGAGISAETLDLALDASLERLKTDYLDLYQLHWPNRGSYHFRQNWSYDPSSQNRAETEAHMVEVLGKLKDLRDAGKIRAVGLSNETAWGTAQWLRLARDMGAPEMLTIQNEYSLLCRFYDLDLAELAVNEGVTLLAYTPLAGGMLSGKYDGGRATPEGSRRAINETIGGRVTDRVWPAIDAYLDIARRHDLDPSEMAFAWTRTRPFPTIPIFGSTTVAHVETAARAADLKLSDEVLAEIETAHRAHPMPF